MIKIDTDNLLFSKSFLNLKYSSKLRNVMKNINNKYENGELQFLDVDKNDDLEEIESYVKENIWNYEDIVILGIGWSALWTRSIMQAIKWNYYNELTKQKRNSFPKLHILDNVDPTDINNLLEIILLKETLFIVISKSWSTLETMSQFNFFKKLILKQWLKLKNHFVIVAWENSNFKRNCIRDWFKVFDIPEGIWWRFSVFTNVWLLPLAFIWIDIRKILKWVKDSKVKLLSSDISENNALLTSIIQYHTYLGLWKNITVFFPYSANLFFLWEWYKQMIWESLWKWWIWVTLTSAIWVTDQHSQLQLYYDWPNDKLIIFLEVLEFENDVIVWDSPNLSFWDLIKYEKIWTEESISNYNKINYTIKIPRIDEETLWWIILMLEMQTAILWELYGLNAFNQPWVEIWKKITKQSLEKNIWNLDFLNSNTIKNITFIWWWNGQSSILRLFKDYLKKNENNSSLKYDITSIVSMSDDWRTTWMLMTSFKEELWLHLPPTWDIRRILFTLSDSKYKDFFEIIFNKILEIDSPIEKFNLWDLFILVSREVLNDWKLLDLKNYVKDFLNNKWEIYELINSICSDISNFRIPLKISIKWHKFWNILMASLYYNLWKDYNEMIKFMINLLEIDDKILPITTDPAYIKAILEDWTIIKNQDNISNIVEYKSKIDHLEIIDSHNLPTITNDVRNAIKNSDYIIIGPWDLYTSIIANFIIGWLTEEIEKSETKILYLLNANNKFGETTWYEIIDFIDVIESNIWSKKIDYLFVNNKAPELDSKLKNKFKNDISVKWWDYLVINDEIRKKILIKYPNLNIISWEYIFAKDLYKYNENLIKDLISVLK